MRRLIAALLSCVLLLSLAACGGGAGDGAVTQSAAEASQSALSSTEATTKASDSEQEEKVIDIYLIAGQSNATGHTVINNSATIYSEAPQLKAGYSNVHYAGAARYDVGSDRELRLNPQPWQKAKLGLGAGDNRMGPEAGIAVALSEYYNEETGKHAGIIKFGHGGTNLLNADGGSNKHGNWVSPSYAQQNRLPYSGYVGGLYRGLVEEVKIRIGELYEYGGFTKVNIKAMYWMQGESDRSGVDKYADAFRMFMEDLRADLSIAMTEYTGTEDDCGALEMPVIVGTISQTFCVTAADPDGSKSNLPFVQMQQRLPETVPNCFVVDNSHYKLSEWNGSAVVALGSDPYHWNQSDCFAIGKTVGTVMLELGVPEVYG